MGLNKTLHVTVKHTTTINFHTHLIDDHDTADHLQLVFQTNIPQDQYSYGKPLNPHFRLTITSVVFKPKLFTLGHACFVFSLATVKKDRKAFVMAFI